MKAGSVEGKTVLVAGASGGLAAAMAQRFAREGARVICVARSGHQAQELAARLGPRHATISLDLTDAIAIDQAREQLWEVTSGKLDIVVNSVGGDVRKSFDRHTGADFQRMYAVNFLAAANLLKLCLSMMRTEPDFSLRSRPVRRQFIQITGFLNARIGFPFYSADVAMRSATRTLFECVQRELTLQGRSDVKLRLFSPAVAETDAERRYLGIWRSMGIEPVTPDDVASALLKFTQGRRSVGAMGGWSNRTLAGIKDISPSLADRMWLSQAGKALSRAFDAPALPPAEVRSEAAAQ